ncbi:MAG: peptidyl-prolyl cis-trans isomerase [Rickettsiales bacterium]|jgi:peptidyl-prolyl cis-trans isomerase C|nr:peptidyl-prolyl cis-trans isomerase [Rickettsiales bacterium]
MRKEEKQFLLRMVVGITTVATLLTSFLVCNHYVKYHRVNLGKSIAKINGVVIYERDLEEFLFPPSKFADAPGATRLKPGDMNRKALEALVREIYANKIVYRAAKKYGMTVDNDIKFLTEKYREQLVREKFINEKIINNIREEDLKERYQQLVDMMKDKEERKISHIVVATEEEADRIKNMIQRFNNFESTADKKSLDRESAVNGGSLGYVLKENIIIPEFAEIAFLLKTGELSRPIETKNGWHVIRVDDIRNIKIKTYEESRNDILEQMRQERFEEFIESFNRGPKTEFFLESDDKTPAVSPDPPENEKPIVQGGTN